MLCFIPNNMLSFYVRVLIPEMFPLVSISAKDLLQTLLHLKPKFAQWKNILGIFCNEYDKFPLVWLYIHC